MRIVMVMGTRPEAIKLAPVVEELKKREDEFDTLVVVTGQHRQMLDQVLRLFHLQPDLDLDLMQPDQDLAEIFSRVLLGMKASLAELKPDLVLVQGDTTTACAAALAAFFHRVPVGHVEAGLRSHNLYNPFPEEVNRHLTAVLTEIHLAPTPLARQNLVAEGIPAGRIAVTGNTVVDAQLALLKQPWNLAASPLSEIPLNGHRIILVTSHRRESWGEDLANICLALKDLVAEFHDILVLYPVHLNPRVRQTVYPLLSGVERLQLLPPLDYLPFLHLMEQAHLIVTDSGGVLEEAPTLHKPVLIIREVTERPEAVEAGLARIVGTGREVIRTEAARLLTDAAAYQAMAQGKNPYGDGRAAPRIVEAIHRWSQGLHPLLEPAQQFRRPRS
jgi:UDP-N-acetylglucosamine 2-epimerase (non-hydrolysing)